MQSNTISDLLRNLPKEPREAFIEIASRASSIAEKIEDDDDIRITQLVKLLEKFAILQKLKVEITPIQEDETWRDQLSYILNHKVESVKRTIDIERIDIGIDDALQNYDNEQKGKAEFGEAVLTPNEKAEIHSKLNDIRDKVERSSLTNAKKRSLHAKIVRLAFEVDKYGTSTDIFMGFALDLSILASKMHKNAAPIIQDVKDILNTIYVGRARTEGVELPKPIDLPTLPSPPTE